MTTDPAAARRDDVTDELGGVRYADPYRWLEDDADPEVAAWQAAQTAQAEAAVAAWSGASALHAAIAAATVDSRLVAPRPAGGRWFRQVVLAPEDEQPVLVVADEPLGAPTVLVDPNALSTAAGTPIALDWYVPSPDARYVAYGLSEGGSEQSVLHVVEVATGRVLDDRIPHMALGVVAWLPDASGFYCNAGLADPTQAFARQVLFHRLGDPAPTQPEDVDLTGVPLPLVQVSADGRWGVVVVGGYHLRPGFVRDLVADGPWRPFVTTPGTCFGEPVGDRYVAVTTRGAPRGRVVAIPLDGDGDPATWVELLPGSDAVVRGVAAARGCLVTSELVDALPRVRVLEPDGDVRGELALPGAGSVSLDARTPAALPYVPLVQTGGDSATATFVHSAPDVAPALYAADLDTLAVRALTHPARRVDGLVTASQVATSADGTAVPVTLVHRADVAPGEQPVLVHGYGGFNVAFFPGYAAHLVPFLEAGGVYALAHIRGGGELGEAWWEAGRLAHKQRGPDDLYAVAEHLVATGRTSPARLAVMGGSNGGLLTAIAVTQRPELFAAVVSLIPVTDLFRGVKDPVTGYVIASEYGNPADPEQAAWLASYSPCQNVRERTAYPTTFIGAGEHDLRCPPWHARKLAALLQHAQAGDAPILLHVQADAGHGPGKPSSVAVANAAAWVNVVMATLGMAPPR